MPFTSMILPRTLSAGHAWLSKRVGRSKNRYARPASLHVLWFSDAEGSHARLDTAAPSPSLSRLAFGPHAIELHFLAGGLGIGSSPALSALSGELPA